MFHCLNGMTGVLRNRIPATLVCLVACQRIPGLVHQRGANQCYVAKASQHCSVQAVCEVF